MFCVQCSAIAPKNWDALREEVELEAAARQYEHFYIRILDERGVPLLTTPGMVEELDLLKLQRQTQARSDRVISAAGRHGQPFRFAVAAAPVGVPSTGTDTIQIAIDVSHEQELLVHYRLWFWGILAGALVICPLVGYQIARRGILPVEEMAATARRISSTNLQERMFPEGYPGELASLASTFNNMLNRLEESFDRISRFSADMAHDLRTPVNNIRGEVEVALARARTINEYRDVLGSVLEEAVRLSDLIANLLFLARTESPAAHLNREHLNLTELLGSMREYYEASAADAGITLTVLHSVTPVLAEADRALIQRALGNLISNAIAHTQAGGSVLLAAYNGEGAAVRIEVTDTGSGIPVESVPRVFDRFYRVDSSRSRHSGGTGLGLAIVQAVMVLHSGQAEVASRIGEGTRVTLRLPICQKRAVES